MELLSPVKLEDFIRDVKDFPAPGVLFKDITPLLQSPEALEEAIHQMAALVKQPVDAIAALDARGFIFGTGLALHLKLPLILMRKKGKLPAKTRSASYTLEYGTATLEAHTDSFPIGARVLLVDDLLATGGTMRAACTLVEELGASVAGCIFLAELSHLGGRRYLKKYDVTSLVLY